MCLFVPLKRKKQLVNEHAEIIGKVTQFFPYRTASPRDRFLSLPRDTTNELEERLAAAAGNRLDNHTVYEITTKAGTKVYIMFHDFVTVFGHSVEVRDW